jgi:hypothetical protein
VNGLLRYLETDGADAVVRPWVWIALVSGGPLVAGMLQHLARFVAVRRQVCGEIDIRLMDGRVEQDVRPYRLDHHGVRLRACAADSPRAERAGACVCVSRGRGLGRGGCRPDVAGRAPTS